MPEIDGLELGRMIAANPEIATVKRILLTSGPRQGDAERARHVGYAAVLTKPIRYAHLRACMASLQDGKSKESSDSHALEDVEVPALRKRALNILLVEDNELNQRLAGVILNKRGHQVDVAENGQRALEFLAKNKYDLVLMDCQMPVMDGYEATRCLRANTPAVQNPRVPVIAMTANARQSDRDRCLEAGMNDFIAKPINQTQMVEVIERVLAAQTEVDA
jgi:two-component system, sensor histidine kinase and response regulator